jgi:hypothetical protein
MRSDDPMLLRAALLGDIPTLRESGARPARRFADTLSLWLRPEEDEVPPDSPLEAAAIGLAAELTGDQSSATARYGELARWEDSDPETQRLTRMLGAALLAWAEAPSDEVVQRIEAAAGLADGADGELRSLYLTKLAAFALDKGHRELGLRLLRRAVTAAEGYPVLQWRVRDVLRQLTGPVTRRDPKPTGEEPLHGWRWIVGMLADAGRKALVQSVIQNARSPWAQSWRFGHTETDEANAAALQAAWGGALWLLPAARLQAGAQLLAGGATSPDGVAYGLALWALGEGASLRAVAEAVELGFDKDSAHAVFETHLVKGRALRRPRAYVELALALWDLLPDESARSFLQSTTPTGGDHPEHKEERTLFAVLSLRSPTSWAARYWELPHRAKNALVDAFGFSTARRLPSDVKSDVAERTMSFLETGNSADEDVWLTALATGGSGATRLLELLEYAPATVRVGVAVRELDLRPYLNLTAAIDELASAVARALEEGRRGTVSFPQVDTIHRLGLALSISEAPAEATELLVRLATDDEQPAELRLRGLQALSVAAGTPSLQPSDAHRVATTRLRIREPEHPGSPPQNLLRIHQLLVASAAAPSLMDYGELIGLSRDADSRVRQVAVRVAARLPSTPAGDPVIRSLGDVVIYAGLFDSEQLVAIESVAAVGRGWPLQGVDSPAVTRRLETMFERSPRRVRLEICTAAGELARRNSESSGWSALLRRAEVDRSWLVRDAARRAGTEGPLGE